ncbi:MAG: hypothetical protein RL434_3056 [Pseudomonadota bacterium]|jgi:DNA polymerase-3 subunit delta
MQVRPEQLPDHLARKGLQSRYLLHGPEPLQAMESADAIRSAARGAGIAERVVFDGSSQDWTSLRGLNGTLSLFAERRLIEIRLTGKKPDRAGLECLAELLGDDQSPDVFLVLAGALDRRQQEAAWVQACERQGVVVGCREPDETAFRGWLAGRARARGLELTAEAIEFLALRTEGNLVAATQEVDKLTLLAEGSSLDLAAVLAAVSDTARYDTFQCVDAALAGQPARTVRVLRGLRAEGNEPVLINFGLVRELRTLTRVAAARACGASLEQAFRDLQAWPSRQPLLRQALQRHPVARLSALLEDAIRLDQLIKGHGLGNVWDDLESLLLALASVSGTGKSPSTSGES